MPSILYETLLDALDISDSTGKNLTHISAGATLSNILQILDKIVLDIELSPNGPFVITSGPRKMRIDTSKELSLILSVVIANLSTNYITNYTTNPAAVSSTNGWASLSSAVPLTNQTLAAPVQAVPLGNVQLSAVGEVFEDLRGVTVTITSVHRTSQGPYMLVTYTGTYANGNTNTFSEGGMCLTSALADRTLVKQINSTNAKPYIPYSKLGPHTCEYINQGFSTIRMACKHCGKEQT